MRDVDEGDAELALHAPQLGAHLDAQLLVERGQRLVEQQYARLGDGRTRERHTLLLAAGELSGQTGWRARSDRTFSSIASVAL